MLRGSNHIQLTQSDGTAIHGVLYGKMYQKILVTLTLLDILKSKDYWN